MKEQAVVLFGGNLGQVRDTFKYAHNLLVQRGDLVAVSSSSLYRSPAWGFTGPDFLNQVVIYNSHLSAMDLLEVLLEVEVYLKRQRTDTDGYESRPIDLDLLYFGSNQIKSDRLIVPHPRLHLRRFTLEPLVELIPNFIHPGIGKTQLELLNECEDRSEVEKL